MEEEDSMSNMSASDAETKLPAAGEGDAVVYAPNAFNPSQSTLRPAVRNRHHPNSLKLDSSSLTQQSISAGGIVFKGAGFSKSNTPSPVETNHTSSPSPTFTMGNGAPPHHKHHGRPHHVHPHSHPSHTTSEDSALSSCTDELTASCHSKGQ